ncbi:hypothetical protein BX600DRAFT_525902 [Xylariales sp. PMI_506]|nr:hypothetical protein BX600DRAFT_525902 [Xylariales sp. PMI_506]
MTELKPLDRVELQQAAKDLYKIWKVGQSLISNFQELIELKHSSLGQRCRTSWHKKPSERFRVWDRDVDVIRHSEADHGGEVYGLCGMDPVHSAMQFYLSNEHDFRRSQVKPKGIDPPTSIQPDEIFDMCNSLTSIKTTHSMYMATPVQSMKGLKRPIAKRSTNLCSLVSLFLLLQQRLLPDLAVMTTLDSPSNGLRRTYAIPLQILKLVLQVPSEPELAYLEQVSGSSPVD